MDIYKILYDYGLEQEYTFHLSEKRIIFNILDYKQNDIDIITDSISIIQNNYNAGLGETIYYINNGTKKSSGDVQKISKPTKKQ